MVTAQNSMLNFHCHSQLHHSPESGSSFCIAVIHTCVIHYLSLEQMRGPIASCHKKLGSRTRSGAHVPSPSALLYRRVSPKPQFMSSVPLPLLKLIALSYFYVSVYNKTFIFSTYYSPASLCLRCCFAVNPWLMTLLV